MELSQIIKIASHYSYFLAFRSKLLTEISEIFINVILPLFSLANNCTERTVCITTAFVRILPPTPPYYYNFLSYGVQMHSLKPLPSYIKQLSQ
jgi:hypothetical protein